MIKLGQPARPRPVLFIALALSIPAFYLVLSGASANWRAVGGVLYGAAAIMIVIDVVIHARKTGRPASLLSESTLNVIIALGALASVFPTEQPWPPSEWLLRLGLCSLVFIRMSMLLAKWVTPRNLLHILAVAVGLLALSGLGFYLLEPSVRSYADGLWLAFVTGATVGYGDVVPTSAGARIFAVFIVLLGYAVFSVVTATISAMFVGQDEKTLEKELHAEMRSLRKEIAGLRADMQRSAGTARKDAADDSARD